MFNSPMSLDRANNLIALLDSSDEEVVFDIGCGDGAFLQQFAKKKQINGIGVDHAPDLIQIANQQLAGKIRASKLQFICADATEYIKRVQPLDIIIAIGSEYIFGGYRDLLKIANAHLKSSGKLLIGTIYWKQAPSPDYLTLMDGENPYFELAKTVELAYEQGFIPLAVQRSNDDEWDVFESQHARKHYLNAIEASDKDKQARTWQWQQGYLKWGITTMGFCFLILQKTI